MKLMRMITPLTITSAMLTSSTVPETDYADWNIATPYVKGDRVIRATTHKIYECLDPNTGYAPEDNLTQLPTPKWLLIGSTNKFCCIDGEPGSQTTASSSLTVVLTPGRFDSLALINIDASRATVVIKDAPGGTVIYSKTISLTAPCRPNWNSWAFSPVFRRPDYVFLNLPRYLNCEVSITLTAPGTVALGDIVAGMAFDLGRTLAGVKISMRDFSDKDYNRFGAMSLTVRGFAKKEDIKTDIDNFDVDSIAAQLNRFRAVPCVYIGAENSYTSMIIYGTYVNYDISVDSEKRGYLTMSIQGLTQK